MNHRGIPDDFYNLECEHLGTLEDGIQMAEQYITCLAIALLRDNIDLINEIAGNAGHVIALLSRHKSNDDRFPRITLNDALALPEICWSTDSSKYINEGGHSERPLTRDGERLLITKFGGAVWLTEMDHLSVPFYQAFAPDNFNSSNKKALCADLLLGEGEVLRVGGRHVDVESVKQAIEMHKLPVGFCKWYLGIRGESRGGRTLQTAGWVMGMERLLAWLLRHDGIRDMAVSSRLRGKCIIP